MRPVVEGLIETFRREADGTMPRLNAHLDRLARSARHFGFSGLPDLRGLIDAHVFGPGARRVRLEVSADGRAGLADHPFVPLEAGTVWRARIAATPMPGLPGITNHKTTLRGFYEAARAEAPASDIEDMLLLAPDGSLAEGTITTLFLPDGAGRLLTPPLSTGCLAGVLRAELLAAGQAVEAAILPGDLAGRSFFLGNSLRGLIAARLA